MQLEKKECLQKCMRELVVMFDPNRLLPLSTGPLQVPFSVKDRNIFNVYESVHRKYIPIYIQQDAILHSLFISGNCSTCFGWYFHPSSEAHTTVSTASGICHTVTAICRYNGRVAYATHSTLRPVPTLPR